MHLIKWKPLLAVVIIFSAVSCGGKNDKNNTSKADTPLVIIKDSLPRGETAARNAPIINITDSIAPKRNIIYIKDSAATSVRLSQKLAQIYSAKLQAVIKTNNLKVTGAPMAWYKTQKAPFFFEAGIPVDKKPAKLPKNILYKVIGGDSAFIAHYYGPYEQTGVAYEALEDRLKDQNKKLRAPAYEVYVSDPFDKAGKPVDPYKVQTDIVFPH